jgi:hypothetical protein
MKQITLDFVDRIKLAGAGAAVGGVLGLARGGTAKMSVCIKLYETIRFSEEESTQMTIVPGPNGQTFFTPPVDKPDFGLKQITIEDLWATVLIQELDAFPDYALADFQPGSWRERLLERLKVGGDAVAAPKGKRK